MALFTVTGLARVLVVSSGVLGIVRETVRVLFSVLAGFFTVRRNLGGVALWYFDTNSAVDWNEALLDVEWAVSVEVVEVLCLCLSRSSRWNLNGLTFVPPGGVGGLVDGWRGAYSEIFS